MHHVDIWKQRHFSAKLTPEWRLEEKVMIIRSGYIISNWNVWQGHMTRVIKVAATLPTSSRLSKLRQAE